jgi:hypothetical protein
MMEVDMRNLVFSAILLTLGATAIANEGLISAIGGTVSPKTAEHQSIQLVRERITLTLYEDYYSVLVSSVFYNFGETTTIQVGFPEFSLTPAPEDPWDGREFRDFETEVDGRKVQFQRKTAVAVDYSWTKNWYVKDVQFPQSDYTTTTIKYSTSYFMGGIGREGTVYGVQYLFGTGLTWKGEIKEVEFVVQNEAEKWIDWIQIWVGKKRYLGSQITEWHFLKAVDRNTFRIRMFNIEPQSLEDHLQITFYNSDTPYPFYTQDEYYFDKKPISSFYLNVLSKKQLRIVRNVIYAWHGYSFRSPDLRFLFASQDWYEVNPDYSESNLNQQERVNRNTILEEEILREAIEMGLQ